MTKCGSPIEQAVDAHVILAGVGKDDNDGLAGVFRAAGQVESYVGGGAGCYARQQPLLGCDLPAGGKGVFYADSEDFVYELRVVEAGYKTGTDAQQPVGLELTL